jgi:hypothetical protein
MVVPIPTTYHSEVTFKKYHEQKTQITIAFKGTVPQRFLTLGFCPDLWAKAISKMKSKSPKYSR